ncbi:unnamed protein product [Blepharisma stoltei]|uniref:Endonuclease/exonuclease/phosphatase domain-containing protein n=1 Tax=Blepharisma stoltei TaxID=1481888 RepID=A0AAU9J3Y6_9CILI|nr:unnamed protein product [Blepharisma stoltei]
MEIKVGSFNILNTSCRYHERKHLVSRAIGDMNCDFLGLQEINFQGNRDILALPHYTLKLSQLPSPMTKAEPEFRIDGNATLIKSQFPILDEAVFTYNSRLRVAQRFKCSLGSQDIWFINTHLDHLSDETRLAQVQELIEWINPILFSNIILVGDFNFIPNSEPYKLMTKYFKSAFKQCNGEEPVLTFPTGLYGPWADIDRYGAFDYVFIRGNLECIKADVVTNIGRGSLFPSDHFPISTVIRIK